LNLTRGLSYPNGFKTTTAVAATATTTTTTSNTNKSWKQYKKKRIERKNGKKLKQGTGFGDGDPLERKPKSIAGKIINILLFAGSHIAGL